MKKCLIVVDYQNDFVDGSLGFLAARLIENEIVKKIEEYRVDGDVIFTLDTHDDKYMETLEGKSLPVAHCLKNTIGHELYGKVKTLWRKEDPVFIKNTYPSLDLGNFLKNKDYDIVELCGVVTNICVISNAVIVKSALPDTKIIIDRKAVASNDKKLEEDSFRVMENLNMDVIA